MDERTTDPPAGDASAPQPPVPRIGDDGKPVHDQEFFLALARQGRKLWNQWRKSNPDIRVIFKGLDFNYVEDAPSFAGFRFGDNADFSGVVLKDEAKFSYASFGSRANFSDARIGSRVNFSGAAFGDGADFSNATIGYGANFSRTIFGRWARFAKLDAKDNTNFSNAIFGAATSFSHSVFGKDTNFSGSVFGDFVDFSHATFTGRADFSAKPSEDWEQMGVFSVESQSALQSWLSNHGDLFVSLAEELRQSGAGPESFLTVYFPKAVFHGLLNFSGRKIIDRCELTGVRFYEPPSFDAGDRLDRLDLYGASIEFSGEFGFSTYPTHLLNLSKIFSGYADGPLIAPSPTDFAGYVTWPRPSATTIWSVIYISKSEKLNAA